MEKLAMKTIDLGHGFFTIVDDDDFEFLSKYKWHSIKAGRSPRYAVTSGRKSNGRKGSIYMQRLLLGDGDYVSDHINGDGLDNRRSNLRKATHHQNAWNSKKKKNGTTSQYKGVGWVKKDGAFRARIRTNLHEVSLGYFDNEVDAARAYNRAAKQLFGEFAKLNDVPD